MASNNFANIGSGVGNQPVAFGGPGTSPVIPPTTNMGGAAIPSVGRTLQLPLPEVVPIPDAKEFNPAGSVNLVGVSNGVLIPMLPSTLAATNPAGQIEIPAGSYGVIRGVTFYVNNMLATTVIAFTLLVDGKGVSGYTAIPIFPRVSPSVSNGFDSMIRLVGPCIVTAIVSATDGGSYPVGCALSGWYWPQSSDLRWKTQGPV